MQDLDGIGLSWDASRLAAQAAARTTDRQDMLDLHHVASIRRRLGSTNRQDMLATLKRLVEATDPVPTD